MMLSREIFLGHKNVKVFVTQGGMQSLEESLLSEVPMVVIPFVSDQNKNSVMLSNLEVAIILNKKTVNKEIFKDAILEVIQNPK